MRKYFYIVLLILIFTLFLNFASAITEVSIDIDNSPVYAGQAVTGTVTVRLLDNASGGTFRFGFRPDLSTDSFECQANPRAVGDTTICTKKFTHVFENPGRAEISVKGPGIAMVIEKIEVLERPEEPDSFPFESPLKGTSTVDIMETIIDRIYWIGASIAFIMIILGGLYILTSAGNPAQANRGRLIIFYTLIGLAIMILANGIINLIYAIIGIKNNG